MTEVRSSRRSGDDQWGAGGHTIATPMPKLRMYTMPLTSFCAYLNGTAQAHNFLKDSTLEKAPSKAMLKTGNFASCKALGQ